MQSLNWNKIILYSSIIFSGLYLLFISVFSISHYGGSDSLFHYLHSVGVKDHSELYVHHWGKPLFILLSSPFTYFGVTGVKVFNALLMLSTSILSYKIAQHFKLQYAFITIFLVIFAPVFLPFAQSALTEPLFAFMAVLSALLFIKEKYIWSALVISFIIFTRSEGLSFVAAYAFGLLIKKQFKAIPFLAVGFIIYGIAGYYLIDNFWWFITDNPYTGAKDLYGSGTLTHYLEDPKSITGNLAAVFIVIGLIAWGVNVIKDKRNFFSPFAIVILSTSFLFIAGHSYVWWKGLSGSLGLLRVMGGVTPLLAIIAMYGISHTILFFNKFYKNEIVNKVIALTIIFFIVLESHNHFNHLIPLQPDEINLLVEDSINWLNDSEYLDRKTYVYRPEYLAEYGSDHFDRENSRVSEAFRNIDVNDLKKGDIIVWDGHFSPNEGGVPLEKLSDNTNFQLLKSFVPEHEIRVLGDHIFSIEIYEKL